MNLVDRFKDNLREEGVKIIKRGRGNSYIAEKEDISIGVLIYEYTPKNDHTKDRGFWGPTQKIVEGMKKVPVETGGNWGMVLLRGKLRDPTLDFGFWIHGKNYESVQKHPNPKRSVDNINLQYLEANPHLAEKFLTVQEFFQLSGLDQR